MHEEREREHAGGGQMNIPTKVVQSRVLPNALIGRWQELAGAGEVPELVHAVITDAPYSPRTHSGHRTNRVEHPSLNGNGQEPALDEQEGITLYEPLTVTETRAFASYWCARTLNWIVIFGDHITFQWWSDALEGEGWYTFAPVGWVRKDPMPRVAGEGPTRSVEWICVARPRRVVKCGSLRGDYPARKARPQLIPGQKDVESLRPLIRDYSEPGEMIVDLYGGVFSIARAARIERRNFWTCEVNPRTALLGTRELLKPYTSDMFAIDDAKA